MMIRKLLKFICVLVLALGLLAWFFYAQFEASTNPQFGLNFSLPYMSYLGFDWKQAYLEILDELKPKHLRIMAYWEILEPEPGKFKFSDMDFMLKEAEKHNAKVILVLGQKQPRWPECHHPGWYKELSDGKRETALLAMLKESVSHFKNFKSITRWQLENEPFFAYGPDCPVITADLLDKEIALVKSLDARPILLTDSGEKGAWLPTAKKADVFGSTMYREVYYDGLGKYMKYPIPPFVYRVRAGFVKVFSKAEEFVGVELQAEPWFSGEIFANSREEQNKHMNRDIFLENIEYARKVGFAENYLWGVEWWYYFKDLYKDDSIWQEAKKVLSQ